MSYHVSILRTKDANPIPITNVEIELLANTIPGFEIRKGKVGELDLVCNKDGKEVAWLTLQDGELWTSNPDNEEIQTMLNVAQQLGHGARVRGGDFLTYRTVTETITHKDDIKQMEDVAKFSENFQRDIRRKQRLLNFGLLLFFGLLGALVIYFSN